MSSDGALFDASCVAHVHSTYSDGTATVPELLDAAAASGRDALLLTDHDTLEARDDGWEGRHGSVLLIVGTEISPKAGHVLAFDTDAQIDHAGREEAQILAELERCGGFAFIAHPFSQGARMSRRIAPPHGWSSLDAGGYAGIELWSLVTDSAESWRSPREAIAFMRDPERHIQGPPQSHLQAWDALCQLRKVAALGGLDAHQSGVRIRNRVVSPMPNERYFGLFGTHLLTRAPLGDDPGVDRTLLLDALREGRSYLALDFVGDPRGFEVWAENGDRAEMGERANGEEWTLRVRTSARAELRLVRDGKLVRREFSKSLDHTTAESGVYRVEAWRTERGCDRLWIVSNPIYLRGPAV
jgi:hypothetical protein